MRIYLLDENLSALGIKGEGVIVVACNKPRARELAAAFSPNYFAQDGRNLWKSPTTKCQALGRAAPSQQEGVILKGTFPIPLF